MLNDASDEALLSERDIGDRDQDAATREPSLDEILTDDIMAAILERDGLSPQAIRELLSKVGARRRLLGLDAPDEDDASQTRRRSSP